MTDKVRQLLARIRNSRRETSLIDLMQYWEVGRAVRTKEHSGRLVLWSVVLGLLSRSVARCGSARVVLCLRAGTREFARRPVTEAADLFCQTDRVTLPKRRHKTASRGEHSEEFARSIASERLATFTPARHKDPASSTCSE